MIDILRDKERELRLAVAVLAMESPTRAFLLEVLLSRTRNRGGFGHPAV